MALLCAVVETTTLICESEDLLKYSFGSTQVDIDPASDVGQKIKALRDLIPDDHVMAKGREEQPHVTVRYGIQDSASEADIAAYLTRQVPFDITLGRTMVFPATEHSDNAAVVVLAVDAPELERINGELAGVGSWKAANFDYHPHLTLAYVKPDVADQWADNTAVEGLMVPVTAIVISSKDEARTPVALAGAAEKIAPRGARFNCPKCGQYISADGSHECESPGTGPLITSPTQGIESTPDDPGDLPAPQSIGIRDQDDPAVVDNPASVGVGGDRAAAAAQDRSEDPYGVGVEDEPVEKLDENLTKTLLCSAVIPLDGEDDEIVDEDDDAMRKFNELHDRLGRFDFSPAGFHETGLKLKATAKRAFTGKQVKLKMKISKAAAGKLGEHIVIAHLQKQGFEDARPVVLKGNNFPVDVVQNHGVSEVKTGLVSNGKDAQQWRATIGEPSEARKAWLSKASPAAKKAFNQAASQAIIDRKIEAAQRVAANLKVKKVSTTTWGVLLNPDTRTADIYRFEGFHSRIGWNTPETAKAYVTSYNY